MAPKGAQIRGTRFGRSPREGGARAAWLLAGLLTACAGEGTLEAGAGDAGPADRGAPDGRVASDARVGDVGPAPFDFGRPGLDAEPPDQGARTGDARVSDAAPPLDAATPLPPPAARPPQPPPDEAGVVRDLAAQRADLFEDSCLPDGQVSPFLVELVTRLRARDVRWGFIVRGGELQGDRIGYYYGLGVAEGSPETYVLDVIGSYCPGPGDNPSSPSWLDDTAAGGTWTLAPLSGQPLPDAGPPPPDAEVPAMLPLPDESDLVDALAAERPDLLEQSCVNDGGNNEFLFELVRRLRARDVRWGLNWKRGNVGDMSQDVVDYFWAQGDPEGRTEVYIIDVIGGHCPGPGDPPSTPAWTDVTEATRLGGTIGRWTLQPLP
jgi:hypothetical protein